MLAAWKLGAIAVPVNPMLRERELAIVLSASGTTALVCLDSLYEATAAVAPPIVLTMSELDYLTAGSTSPTARRTRSRLPASRIWPREVEDVLYEHPAVREAAVVGVPDAYRGETVQAFVSLKPDAAAGADELPKTPTGKILRRALR